MLPDAAIRAVSWCFSRKIVPVARRVWRVFLPSGYKFYCVHCACRGTKLISGREIVPVREVYKWALAQCRGISLSRRQKIVMVQDFDCVQMRVSGCNSLKNLSWVVGAKAKTVTSNLPLLSVLAQVLIKSSGSICLVSFYF